MEIRSDWVTGRIHFLWKSSNIDGGLKFIKNEKMKMTGSMNPAPGRLHQSAENRSSINSTEQTEKIEMR